MKKFKKLKKLLNLAMSEPVWTVLSFILSAMSAVSVFVPFYCIRSIIFNFESGINEKVVFYGTIAFAGAAANVIFYFASLICSHVASFNIAYDLKLKLADKLSRIPIAEIQERGTGNIYGITDGSVGKVTSFVAHQMPDIVTALCSPIFLSVLMFITDWRYALISIGAIAFAYIFNLLSSGPKGSGDAMEVYLAALDKMTRESVEYARGIKEIKMYGQADGRFNRLVDFIKEYTHICIPYTLVWEKYRCIFEGVIRNIYLFVMPVALAVIAGTPSSHNITSFIFFLILTSSVATHFSKAGGLLQETARGENELEKIDELMNIPDLPVGDKKKIKETSVAFDNVSFSYGERKVLDGISFEVKPGTMTAIVGKSGSGKTTIAMLLSRFRDVESGTVKIGNINVNELTQESLHKNISIVFQDPFIFSQSIAQNIRNGFPDASPEEIKEAAKKACAHEFISRLPEGYDTVVGKEGYMLSGGEKQRIAIAAAILKKAPIVVLDEVTAAADPENEYGIQQAIKELVKDKTVIIIAHRLSGIINADEIIVLKEGRIAQRGKHSELIKIPGEYLTMWKTYNKAVEWKIGG